MLLQRDELPWEKINQQLDGGVLCGSFVALGGRPSTGKTLFLLNIAAYHVFHRKSCVCLATRHNLQFITNSLRYLGKNIYNVTEPLQILQDLFFDRPENNVYPKIWISPEMPCLSPEHTFCPDIVLVDSIESFKYDMEGKLDPHEKMECLVAKLRKFTATTGKTVIASCGIDNKVDNRPGHRPYMVDLQNLGFLEERADQVWLVHRPEIYDPIDKPGVIEFKVVKNNQGKCFAHNCMLRFKTDPIQGNFIRPLEMSPHIAELDCKSD